MGNETEPLLGDQFACHAADSVGLVLDAHKGSLKILDELVLPLGKLTG